MSESKKSTSSKSDNSKSTTSRTESTNPLSVPGETISFGSSLESVSENIPLSKSSRMLSEVGRITTSLSQSSIHSIQSQISSDISDLSSPTQETDYLEPSTSSGGVSSTTSSRLSLQKSTSESLSSRKESTEPEPSTSGTSGTTRGKSFPQPESTFSKPHSSRQYSLGSLSTSPVASRTSVYVSCCSGKLTIKGIWNRSLLTREPFCSFFGIRYAKAPIKELRFKPPQPLEDVYKSYDATKEKDFCIQRRYCVSKAVAGSEDCLYLNVHTPREPNKIKTLLPVMVYIHGGGFFSGSGNSVSYSADYLMKYDVILVTFNYRLHILGFLNLEHSCCSGNMGLKDQVMALKWVKKHIKDFGGDPDNITIFGSSAGGSSVNFHMLSPLSANLFNKAIMQSGNVYCPWGLARNSIKFSKELVKGMGGPTDYPKAMFDFLSRLPVEPLVNNAIDQVRKATAKVPLSIYDPCFGPVVEYKGAANPFLPHHPDYLKECSNLVPTIVGLNTYEGLLQFQTDEFLPMNIAGKFRGLLSDSFYVPRSLVDKRIVKVLKCNYFKKKEVNNDSREELVNLYTDMYFHRFYDSFDFILPHRPVYIYEFAYNGGRNILSNCLEEDDLKLPGATHSDEVGYLLAQKTFGTPVSISVGDVEMIDTMCSMWTNFAKYGVPTQDMDISWEPYTPKNPSYLRIDRPLQIIRENLLGERFRLMQEIIDNVTTRF